MNNYYQVWMSAEREEEARKILESLTAKKLIVGGSLMPAPSHFWWKGKQVNLKDYCYVMAFTIAERRKELEEEYSKLSIEEIPMACFTSMEGNAKFLAYIYENTKK